MLLQNQRKNFRFTEEGSQKHWKRFSTIGHKIPSFFSVNLIFFREKNKQKNADVHAHNTRTNLDLHLKKKGGGIRNTLLVLWTMQTSTKEIKRNVSKQIQTRK